MNPKPVLILGIGNILLRDEGVGVHVVGALEKMRLPDCVEVCDGATAGVDLLDVLAERRTVIIVDAVDAGRPPGVVVRFTGKDVVTGRGRDVSLHDIGMAEVLRMTRLLNCAPHEVIVFGIQPESVEPGLELTPTAAVAATTAVDLILEEVGRMF